MKLGEMRHQFITGGQRFIGATLMLPLYVAKVAKPVVVLTSLCIATEDRPRWCIVLVTALLTVLCSVGMPPWPVHADESQYAEFYTIPDPLPDGRPGDLIRSEPSRLVLEPSGQLGAYVATGTRIMYRSTDNRGAPIAVTGTYFEPDNPWPGAGPRPLIVYAPNAPGLGDQCAPSRLVSQGIHYGGGTDITFWYEEGFIATMVARGFAVVVTDYDGVGTGLPSPAFMRLPQGYAVIDAARAAMRLPQTSLDPHGPVAFWGYGQGGGASASAAELAPSYARRCTSSARGRAHRPSTPSLSRHSPMAASFRAAWGTWSTGSSRPTPNSGPD